MRTPTGTLLRCALAALLAVVALSACAGENDPKPGTIKTPKPVTSAASPTPTSPEAQIEATMRAYFALMNAAFHTGDVTRLRSFSSSGCPCRKAANAIERTVKSGGRFEGLRYEVQTVRVHDVEGATGLAEVVAKVPPYKVYNGNGEVTEDSGGGKLHTDFSLVRSGDRWIIGNALNLE